MPKILYVWKDKYPWDVRAEKVCTSLLKNGYDVFILCRWFPGQQEFDEQNGVKIIRAGYKLDIKFTQPLPFNPIWNRTIENIVYDIKPNLIIPREIMLAEACGKTGRKHEIPVVMDMAENYPAAMKDWLKYQKTFLTRLMVHKLDLPEKVEKRAVKLMSGIITVCEEQNYRLNQQFNFPLDKIQVIHNTPEETIFANFERRQSDGKIIFGHHGFTKAEMSLNKFLTGFLEAANINTDIFFHITGSGESVDELKKITYDSKLTDRISFTGDYDYSSLKEILSKFDIGVIPYRINDFNNHTLHNKIFDFFAAGIPVFVSATNPFKRIISETKAGIVVNCEDSNEIKNAILNIKNLNLDEFSKNGIEAFRNKYNWRTDSINLINFIKKFV